MYKQSHKDKTKAGYGDDYGTGFSISYLPARIGTFTIEILDDIVSPDQFSDAIQVLNAATEDHEVVIELQCNGGSLDATDRFIHAMRDCKAPIHCIATGGCHSAATLILLECNSFELSQGFNALIHNGSLGNGGNYNEYVAKAAHDVVHMRKRMESAYRGFLSESEMESMFDGKDIWLDSEGWVARHNARNEMMQKKITELMKKPRKPRAKKET